MLFDHTHLEEKPLRNTKRQYNVNILDTYYWIKYFKDFGISS